MEKGLNFRTQEGQTDYFKAYEESLKLWEVPFEEQYIETSFGKSHVLICGKQDSEPLVLLHAASCGATIWYSNVKALCENYRVYSVDLITESSKSILTRKIGSPVQCAQWLDETIVGLRLKQFNLCGLSIGGWNAANYTANFSSKVKKLILVSPIQTLAKMYSSFFMKIMRMGFNPTRENVEKYIGWGNGFEKPLPDSVIEQFTVSVVNINPNSVFPKMLKQGELKRIKTDILVLLGENEFAFDIHKAIRIAQSIFPQANVEIIKNASHLIPVSVPDVFNEKVIEFLGKS